MLIAVESIPEDGLEVVASQVDAWALDAARVALEVDGGGVEALDVDVDVTLIADHVRVRGSMGATFRRTCDRCGADLRLVVDGDVDLYYSPAAGAEVEGLAFGPEIELESGDLDIGWFDGQKLDMGQVLSEQLALWLPERVLCGAADASDQEGLASIERLGDAGACEVAPLDPGPDLEKHNPFAGLRLPK